MTENTLFLLIYVRSSIVSSRSKPNWNNEEWIVRNIPSKAKLVVSVYIKNDQRVVDNHIGDLEIRDIINYNAPPYGHPIVDSSGLHNGRFHLSVHSSKSPSESLQLPRYTFDGPCRFSRLDKFNVDGIESIWKIQLRRASFFFPPNEYQQSSRSHHPFSLTALSPYRYNESGLISSTDDLWKSVFVDRSLGNIRPRAYNYIIDDSTWQFSEIGDRWLTDSEIKHTRLANSSECVRFAGEFHLRPKFGWTRVDDQWELVFDNASGTYSPKADLLINLKKLLLFNFPELNIVTYDYKDPRLTESLEQLEFATKKYKYNIATTQKFLS